MRHLARQTYLGFIYFAAVIPRLHVLLLLAYSGLSSNLHCMALPVGQLALAS